MYDLIHGNLVRQERGLELLANLLDEEFSLLMDRKTEEIMSLEFSIHELVRQLAREKHGIHMLLGGGVLRDYAAMLLDEERDEITILHKSIDQGEQYCARQAAQNAELSVALLDQSQQMLSFLHKRVQPHTVSTYGRSGAYRQRHPDAALISGRL